MRKMFAIAAVCFTLEDLNNAKLSGACMKHCLDRSHDSGSWSVVLKRCKCSDLVDEDSFESKRYSLPSKRVKTKLQPTVPYIDSSDSKLPWE